MLIINFVFAVLNPRGLYTSVVSLVLLPNTNLLLPLLSSLAIQRHFRGICAMTKIAIRMA